MRDYFRYYKPKCWLFPGGIENKPLTTRTVERVVETAKEKAGIVKPVTVHSLRHSFATHLLENGTDIYCIQKLLGHTDICTTSIYLRMTKVKLNSIKSPLDTLVGALDE
ncbi:MAG: tyrosine-type recombinase/integrase [Bacillota bacterium]|nr:tyrosine-type recombinase/integrase [Bacillota bacterium]